MWSSLNSEYVGSVRKALKEIGRVCPRCMLRLAGVKSSREQRHAEPEIPLDKTDTKKVEVEPESNDVQSNGEPCAKKVKLDVDDKADDVDVKTELTTEPCRACLGVLQEGIMTQALKQLCKEILAAGYDADHFTIAISLPVCLTLRNHSLILYLQEKIPNFDDEIVVPIKQVWKWLFPQRIETSVGKRHVSGESCEFYAELQFDSVEDDTDMVALQNMCAAEYAMRAKKHRKYHMGLVTRQGAEKSLSEVSEQKFRSHYTVPPTVPKQAVQAKVKMYHNSIFIAGRYTKFSRELPQTPWLVDGVRKMETSLEELIAERIKDFFTFDSARFSSSGREDVDVRTLGIGRPFAFEILNPRKINFSKEELEKIEFAVNSSTDKIRVKYLSVVSKKVIKNLKDGEDQKRKTYLALCIAPTKPYVSTESLEKLNHTKNLQLEQKTPIRVLHRRPNTVRPRSVYEMSAEPVPKEMLSHFDDLELDLDSNESSHQMFRLKLTTQAGTYVKEFVHGDFGRTTPNLREILGIPDLDIIALDVLSIDLEWPPGVSEEITNGK